MFVTCVALTDSFTSSKLGCNLTLRKRIGKLSLVRFYSHIESKEHEMTVSRVTIANDTSTKDGTEALQLYYFDLELSFRAPVQRPCRGLNTGVLRGVDQLTVD